jgi:hypothetical protein
MTDDTPLPFDLPSVRRKKLTVDFAGGNQSSNAGLLLVRQAERELVVCRRLADAMPDRRDPDRILDALCRTTGWHRKHAVRALRRGLVDRAVEAEARRERKRRYGATIKDALTALWEASDRVCGKRLVMMIPVLVPALAQHGRLQLSEGEQAQLLTVSAATIDRILGDAKVYGESPACPAFTVVPN